MNQQQYCLKTILSVGIQYEPHHFSIDNLNIITHLKPIAVNKSDEESMEDGLDDASFLSMKPCPSLEDEDSCSSKHKPKPNSPASMIKHRVKRKKKTPE